MFINFKKSRREEKDTTQETHQSQKKMALAVISKPKQIYKLDFYALIIMSTAWSCLHQLTTT